MLPLSHATLLVIPFRLSLKLRPARQSSSKKLPTLSICGDDFAADQLADQMKGVDLDEKKPAKHSPVPQFLRSMSLQPLATKIRSSTLPCFRNNSPTIESGRRSSRRLPRLSSESALNGSDFMNQLHGGVASPNPSPSPFPRRFPCRLPRASRALHPRRPSFESRPSLGCHSEQGSLKPFESPHPRNSFALETPSSRLEIGLETYARCFVCLLD